MANELIRWHGRGGDHYHQFPGGDTEDENEQWDTPPDQPGRSNPNYKTQRRTKEGYVSESADRDAADARSRGDDAFASIRETDAAEHRQTRWDWGDFRTWAVIFSMCAAYLLVSALVYFLPQGRHNQKDGPVSTPTIRVY